MDVANVAESSTLTYRMFGFKGPLWMHQTCNEGSGCPFVQGTTGGGMRAPKQRICQGCVFR